MAGCAPTRYRPEPNREIRNAKPKTKNRNAGLIRQRQKELSPCVVFVFGLPNVGVEGPGFDAAGALDLHEDAVFARLRETVRKTLHARLCLAIVAASAAKPKAPTAKTGELKPTADKPQQ
jgi:hypothetical protein